MEISDLLEMVNHTDALQVVADKLSAALPISEFMARSNPFIPDYTSCETPIIGIFT